MQTGFVVESRFELLELAGQGGMGSVYRAIDRTTGEGAAIKVLHATSEAALARFALEARILSELSLPGIVRYLAHGATEGGDAYLAMEWLDGEDLGQRLARGPLDDAAAVSIVRRAAETLAEAHRRGVVHRDLKPSNLFLVGGDLERVMLLDFGVARLTREAASLTVAGEIVGTPGYMAPEQARGGGGIDSRADVFALGCVLFKCLTGRAPFVGRDVLAVLAKLALETPPRLREVRPDAAEHLDALLARMLAPRREDRFADAAAVAAALAEAQPTEASPPESPAPRPRAGITESEQRVVAVVVAPRAVACDARAAVTLADEDASTARESSGDAAEGAWIEHELAQLAERFGASLAVLRDGSVVMTLAATGHQPGSATDLAARAASCALRVREVLPASPVVVSAGRGEITRHGVVGEAIDKAAALALFASAAAHALVHLDDVCVGLLPSGFDVERADGRYVLRGVSEVDGLRTLLGRPTPCVGRARELHDLEALYDECVVERVSRAVVVTAPAGVGKSRLRRELLHRLSERSPPPEIWTARGDPMSSGSALGMVAQIVRRAASIREGEPDEVRRRKIEALAARDACPRPDVVAEFLGELAGAHFPDDERLELRAARLDRALLADQMERAFAAWLSAACGSRPVALVLEDLHWGDAPTVRYLDAALQALRREPLFVLALGRPEVEDLFPALWSRRHVTRVSLPELGKRASTELARAVLPAADAAIVDRVVEGAAGNALHLEELLRAAAEGGDDAPPDTVVAMLAVRLERLEPEARRVLRAGSVFGRTFWSGGAAALLDTDPRSVAGWLAELGSREVVSVRHQSNFPGETEVVFRHALMRDAAYAMLTPADRALGHKLAGAWLEAHGAGDAIALAEHFERGGDAARATAWLLRASAQAMSGNDLDAAIGRAQRGLELADGADAATRGELHLVQAEAHRWRAEPARAEAAAVAAIAALPPATPAWFTAAAELATAQAHQGKVAEATALLDATLAVASTGPTDGATALAFARSAMLLSQIGGDATAEALVARVEASVPPGESWDPAVRARVAFARAARSLAAGDAAGYIAGMDAAHAEFVRAGELRASCQTAVNAAYGRMSVGAFAAAADALADALAAAERMGLGYVAASARHNLGLALAHLGRFEEALQAESEALRALLAQPSSPLEAPARAYLAEIHRLSGDATKAVAEAERAAAAARDRAPDSLPLCLGVLARALLGCGRAADALAAAEDAIAALDVTHRADEAEAVVHVALVEAAQAAGRTARADEVLLVARERLVARAAKMTDPLVRASFLADVPENARLLALTL